MRSLGSEHSGALCQSVITSEALCNIQSYWVVCENHSGLFSWTCESSEFGWWRLSGVLSLAQGLAGVWPFVPQLHASQTSPGTGIQPGMFSPSRGRDTRPTKHVRLGPSRRPAPSSSLLARVHWGLGGEVREPAVCGCRTGPVGGLPCRHW